MPLRTYETEVRFNEWPLKVEFPRVREWGLLDLVVTVEHQGQPDLWEVAEIEFLPAIHGQEQDDRVPVPEALRTLIEQTMRGREEDRERIRVAISESLQGISSVRRLSGDDFSITKAMGRAA